MQTSDIQEFYETLERYYAAHGRHDMAWRQPDAGGIYDPYKILVSELMLQQTQAQRVAIKYAEFLQAFPTITILAQAELGSVLAAWNGLGYNRRAKFLWQAAQQVMSAGGGKFPDTYAHLLKLPGVGPNTAGAVLAYAFNQPVVYVETNIRTVIIHHFFAGEALVDDAAIRTVLEAIIAYLGSRDDLLSYREFYWAMMDYGTFIKKTVGNLNRASKSYTKQSPFEGSRRQLRGKVIRALTDRTYESDELITLLDDARAEAVIEDLCRESLVRRSGNRLSLS